MKGTELISLGQLILAAVLGALTVQAYLKKRRNDRLETEASATKAAAERDSIAVQSSEKALELMSKLLLTTRESHDMALVEIAGLRSAIKERDARITELEKDLGAAQAQLSQMTQRIETLEMLIGKEA